MVHSYGTTTEVELPKTYHRANESSNDNSSSQGAAEPPPSYLI